MSVLTKEVQDREGFVFARHSLPLLQRMAAELPQVVAVADDRVVGYCLCMPLRFRDVIPSLVPMFEQFARCTYHGRRLDAFRFFVGGQVCVDRAYRGRRLLARLYRHARASLPAPYYLCVTEIASRNRVSLHAHAAMGFETMATYSGAKETWTIVAWNLAQPTVRG
ncbi:MAG TPA: GNAT family N-acetyltransferase [Rhodanobacteraceae bacterium]